jgi:hypothetical protein
MHMDSDFEVLDDLEDLEILDEALWINLSAILEETTYKLRLKVVYLSIYALDLICV